jgi:hypothetical protein
MLLPATAAAAAQASCKLVNPAEQVVERESLHGHFFSRPTELEAVSTRLPGDGMDGFVSSRVTIYAPDCDIVFSQLFSGTEKTLFTDARLGPQQVFLLTTYEPGGSACHYEQIILTYGSRDDDEGVRVVTPARLDHSNQDGLYVGDLGHGRGPGLVLWSALWEDGGHYSPHRYQVDTYLWKDGRFTGPITRVTKKKLDGDPDRIAATLGFPFRDQTGQSRFGEC